MKENEFRELIKKQIVSYVNRARNGDPDGKITENDVFIVWQCKTLQNLKALASTTLPDGMYYEFTYNGDKQETYVDVYKKWENFVMKNKIKDELISTIGPHIPDDVLSNVSMFDGSIMPSV